MTTRTITLTLPEDLLVQIEAQAQRVERPVDDVVAQTIARGLIVASDPDLAPDVQAELAAMEQLADEALWEIAGSSASSDTIAMHDLLTQRQQEGALTAQGQQWLDRLRADADLLLLRKAQAYALLRQRGRLIPALEDLPLPRA
jgi:homoserine acetyltransferase